MNLASSYLHMLGATVRTLPNYHKLSFQRVPYFVLTWYYSLNETNDRGSNPYTLADLG
jgi:hypothetical protein